MAPRSFFSPSLPTSRAYDFTLRLFWNYSTYLAWTVMLPAVRRANKLRFQQDITESTKLVFDTAFTWYVPMLYLCIVLSAGCIMGFLPNCRLRTRGTLILYRLICTAYIGISYACYATVCLFGSRGLAAVAQACQDVEGFCGHGKIDTMSFVCAMFFGCHSVGLSMVWLTRFWYKCIAQEQTRLREEIEEEVRKGAGLVELTKEETLDVGEKSQYDSIRVIQTSGECGRTDVALPHQLQENRAIHIIGKVCQANKPADLSEIPLFEDFCRDIETASKYIALAALFVWKLVELNMIALTWIWYVCATKEQERLRETIEKEVCEGAGPFKLTGEETLDVERKV